MDASTSKRSIFVMPTCKWAYVFRCYLRAPPPETSTFVTPNNFSTLLRSIWDYVSAGLRDSLVLVWKHLHTFMKPCVLCQNEASEQMQLCKPGITCEQAGSPISNIQHILLPPNWVGGMAEATQLSLKLIPKGNPKGVPRFTESLSMLKIKTHGPPSDFPGYPYILFK